MRDFLKVPPGLKKGFLIGLASGTTLALLVAVTVLVYKPAPKDEARPEIPGLTEGKIPAGLSVYHFAVPDGIENFLAPKPAYFREPLETWTPEDVRQFWIDPREIGIEYLSRKNREKLEEIFRSVP